MVVFELVATSSRGDCDVSSMCSMSAALCRLPGSARREAGRQAGRQAWAGPGCPAWLAFVSDLCSAHRRGSTTCPRQTPLTILSQSHITTCTCRGSVSLLEKNHNKTTIMDCKLFSQSHCWELLLYLPRPLTFGTARIVPEIVLPPKYNAVL